jgi:GT2 family glycosyltransferase
MEKFATACVLSFERPDFLRQSISTLTAHAEYPVEVIVHDDGSQNPRLLSMLNSMVASGEISTLISNPPGHNQGQGIALNRMFHAAQGDPILKLDQDLVYNPGWLKRSVEIIELNRANLEAGIEEPAIGAMGLFRYPVEPVKYEDMFIRTWGSGPGAWEEHEDFVGSAMVIPRDVWEAFGPFTEHSSAFAEDRDFKMKVKDEGGLALALPFSAEFATNVGFGVGPSTVVVDYADGSGTVRSIHTEPVIIGKE